MAMLQCCPRCTQALPVTARFCRRCGLAVTGVSEAPVAAAAKKAGSFSSGLLTAVLTAALVVGGVLFFTVVGMTRARRAEIAVPTYTPAAAAPVYQPIAVPAYSAPVYSRPVYSAPVYQKYPTYPAAPVYVPSPAPVGHERYRDHFQDAGGQGR